MSAGCKAYPGNASENFLHVALGGIHVVSFQGTSWKSVPGAPFLVNRAVKELNKDRGTREMVQSLLNDTCPQVVSGLLEEGKSELEQQGQPCRHLTLCSAPGLHLGFSTQGAVSPTVTECYLLYVMTEINTVRTESGSV